MRHTFDYGVAAHPWAQTGSRGAASDQDCGYVADRFGERAVDIDLGNSNNGPTDRRCFAITVSIAVTLSASLVPRRVVDFKADLPEWPSEVKVNPVAGWQSHWALSDRRWKILPFDFTEYSLLEI